MSRPVRFVVAFVAAITLIVVVSAVALRHESVDESSSSVVEDRPASNDNEPDVTSSVSEVVEAVVPPLGSNCSTPSSDRWSPLFEPAVGGWVTDVSISPFDADVMLAGGDVMGLARSGDGGANWQHVDGLLSGEIAQTTWHPVDPGTVWVGTLSGPAVSNDAGRTWAPSRSGMPELSSAEFTAPVEVVLFDPADDRRLLAFGGNRRESVLSGDPGLPGDIGWGLVWESVDGGATWATLADLGGIVTDAVFVSDGRLLAAIDEAGVVESTDGGSTWAPAGNGLDNPNVRDLEVAGNAVFAAVDAVELDGAILAGGLHRSLDGGQSFEALGTGVKDVVGDLTLSSTGFRTVVADPTDPGSIYSSNTGWSDQNVIRSSDGGDNWDVVLDRSVGDLGPHFYTSSPVANDVAIASDGSGRVLLAASEYIILGEEGQPWRDVSSTETFDGTWSGTGYSGLVANGAFVSPSDPDMVILTAFDGGNLLLSRDGAASWSAPIQTEAPFGGGQYAAETADGVVAVLLGQVGVFTGVAVSVDGGGEWGVDVGADSGLPERDSRLNLGGIATHEQVLLVSVGDQIHRRVDEGSWSESSTPEPFTSIAYTSDGLLYGAGPSGMWLSRDDGLSFEPVAAGPSSLWRLTPHPTEPGTVYATSWRTEQASRGLWRYDGSGWVRLTDEFHAYAVAVDPTNPDRLALATDDSPFHDAIESPGVLCSLDGGSTWTAVSEGLPLDRVRSVTFDPHRPGRLITGVNGGGYAVAELGATP